MAAGRTTNVGLTGYCRIGHQRQLPSGSRRIFSANLSSPLETLPAIKTRILLGQESSERAKPILFKEWAKAYLGLEEVKILSSFVGRSHSVEKHLVPFFGGKLLGEIKPEDVEAFRAQWKKPDGNSASVQTVNHDQIAMKRCLNVAIRKGLLQSNPASKVPMPNLQNERDRVLSDEEWSKLYRTAKPHLRPVLLTAYQFGVSAGRSKLR